MPVEVPSASDVDAIAARTKALESAFDDLSKRPTPSVATYIVRPEDYGAKPGKDATAAFQALMDDVDKRLTPDAGGSVPVATVTVLLTGVYNVSGSIMRPKSGRAQGLTFRGLGRRSSEIVMTGAAPLFVNQDRWMGVRFYDVSFRSTNAGASFLYSSSTGACQDWNFTNVEWRGAWKYGVGLDGPLTSNCNSEFVFDRCTVTGSYDVAWFWSGMTPANAQQDQFLNYSFRDCKMEPSYGDVLRFDKGGSVNVSGGSWIFTGKRPDGSPSRFFYLPAGSHFDSVQNLTVTGVRFEPRDAANMVIDAAWKGMIQFLGCMDDAWAFKPYSAGDAYAPHRYTNPSGVRYQGCTLTGRHAYVQSEAPSRQSIVYDQCARTVATRRTKAAFLTVTGSKASAVKVIHRDDRDGIA
jgi:hypothetical protein